MSEERHELSNTMAGALLSYVRRTAGADGDGVVARILEVAGERRSPAELEDSSNWSSFESIRDLFLAAIEVVGDPSVANKAGRDVLRHYTSTAVTSLMRSLGETEAVIRLIADFAGKQTTLSIFECVDSGPTHAVVTVRRAGDTPAQRIWCDYTAGALSAVPDIFGYPFARVDEVECQTRGDGVCRFEVSWQNELADPESEHQTVAEQMTSLTSRFEALETLATELASVDDVEAALDTVTERAAVAVRAPHYLLAVRLPRDKQVRVHKVGLSEAEARDLAEEILADDPDDRDGSRLIVDVASRLHRFGRLAAVAPGASRFAPEERRLLQAYAGHAAAALQTAAALAESRARVQNLQALLDLSGDLADAHATGEVCERLARGLPMVLECEAAVVLIWDDEDTRLTLRGSTAVRGEPGDEDGAVIPRAVARRLAASPRPRLLRPRRSENWVRSVAAVAGIEHGVLMPIAARNELFGVFLVEPREDLGPGDALLGQLPGVASLAATALDNVALIERVHHQAFHDPLTGLPNLRILEHARPVSRSGERTRDGHAVLFVDLDGFKQVNDRLGHACGDDLLVQVAGRLQQDLRTGDRVVRIGGDEFAVLLSEVADVAEARAVAERLLTIVDRPFTVGGTRLTISASIGVAVGSGHETVEQLLARSDAAMYEAKHAGRATVRVSDATG